MRTALAFLFVALAFVGCGKKSSKEYFEARLAYDRLVDQEGDDAYLLPEMMQVSNALAAVPERAIEYPMAQQLVAKIAAEKARVEHEKAVLAADFAVAKPQEKALPPSDPGRTQNDPSVQAKVEAEEPPAGGMPEALFKEKFGSCVTGPESIKVDGELVPAYTASSNPSCLRRLGLGSVAKFFFIKGALAGRMTTTTTGGGQVIVDGGAGKTTTTSTPYLLLPGQPLPPGLGGPAQPPGGTLAPAGTGEGVQPNTGTSDLGARTP